VKNISDLTFCDFRSQNLTVKQLNVHHFKIGLLYSDGCLAVDLGNVLLQHLKQLNVHHFKIGLLYSDGCLAVDLGNVLLQHLCKI